MITVRWDEEYKYDFELEKWNCTHANAYIEKACCPAGTRDCGCQGRDSVVCGNTECQGIEDNEIEALFERLESWRDDD